MEEDNPIEKLLEGTLKFLGKSMEMMGAQEKLRILLWATELSIKFNLPPEEILKRLKKTAELLRKMR